MDREQTSSEAVPNAISEAISKIMANPEILSSVASALGASSPIATKNPEPTEDSDRSEETESIVAKAPSSSPTEAPPADIGAVVSTLAPLLSGLSGGAKKFPEIKHDDKRACLLRALKPYLSPGRREAIDYMISLSQISDLIKHIY